ncbi:MULTISPECIES: hypothetical protein [Nocardiaceae]|uniref:hypothetical protein n=1 Tax=Nocardiaceae TaxID=85025 RepID=UPI00113FDEC2|nr:MULTISPECIES: hypothetical protein [Rhodococcus]
MELDLMYVAGFFDGEGSVGIYKGGQLGRTLRVQITQADSVRTREILKYCQTRWRGSISSLNKQKRRKALIWQTGGSGALEFLDDVCSRVVLKTEQVDLAIAWQKSRPVRVRDVGGRWQSWDADQQQLDEDVAALLSVMKTKDVLADSVLRETLTSLHFRIRALSSLV